MGLESLRKQLGKCIRSRSVGIDRVEREAARVTVVAVTRVGVQARERVLRDDPVGADAPDLADDVAAGVPRVLEIAVRVAEERDISHAEDAGGRALLRLAQRRQALRRHGRVVRAAVTAGEQAVEDLAAVRDHCATLPAHPNSASSG